MARQNKGKKAQKAVGKGKVTPVQIAFIVERYLAEKNYSNTLSAFRSEADHLFSKTKGKEVPKGLLGLGDILDEYICLKEQRVIVDREKRRVEMALQGIQEVMRAYHSAAAAGGSLLPPPSPPLPPPPPPQLCATPTAPFLPASNPTNGSPPSGLTMHGTTLKNCAPSPVLPLKAAEPNNVSTPIPSSANKRKSLKSAPKVPPAPKKSRTLQPISLSMTGGKPARSQVKRVNNTEQNIENLSSVQGSSVAKSLFVQPLESRPAISSSPKTPLQPFPSQAEKSVSPPEDSSLCTTSAATSREITSANCSILSSETIIVSPLKQTGYYAIERCYHVTSSPFKPSPKKLGKREHVKGRLYFDEPDVSMGLEEPVATNSCTSSTQETFDFDLPDLDIFNGDFSFSEFLADIDLTCEGIPSTFQPTPSPADFIQGSEHNREDGSGSCMSTIARVLSEDMNIQGPDSVTSLRSITKCIKILSPSRYRSSCSLEHTN